MSEEIRPKRYTRQEAETATEEFKRSRMETINSYRQALAKDTLTSIEREDIQSELEIIERLNSDDIKRMLSEAKLERADPDIFQRKR